MALLAEAALALHHEINPGAPAERYRVVVHVDAPVLVDPEQPGQSVLEDGAHVSAETSLRLACDASRVVMRHDEDGRVVNGCFVGSVDSHRRRLARFFIAARDVRGMMGKRTKRCTSLGMLAHGR